ncbi:MAG TPA: YdiU family protein [Nitrospiraceae bacterium]|nr:YdiU family protein [Nitrospiraceae bacterium]
MRQLEALHLDNTYAGLPDDFYARLPPTPFEESAYLVSASPDAAALLDLHPDELKRPEFVHYFSGARLLPGSDPIAMLYSGHQFGVYVSRLGDGRAILLGEVRNKAGEKWDLHLKGAGLTPFSRDGDGRAVLRSTIREYLCSEAMHHLGIPTTRALCIIGSDEKVWRETIETGAMLLRMAPSHVRFGSFEVFYYRRQYDHLRTLADYVIAQHYPHLAGTEDRYVQFFAEVVTRTAELIARWQAVGFAHGVMNTDNMSILGLTLDYGPFGFMEDYDPGFICNHSDHHGRYAFDQQPYIGLWNLSCLAQALLPLAPQEPLKAALQTYESTLNARYTDLMCEKLGLTARQPEDGELVTEVLRVLQANRVDYTNFFRALGNFLTVENADNEPLRDLFTDRSAFDAWTGRYRDRLRAEGSRDPERKTRMDRINPKYILRNYLAHEAITRAVEKKDYSEIDRLLDLLRHPYAEQPKMEHYAAPPPNWGKHIIVSCSS